MAKRIIVIGAGICGVSTAIWLRRAGHDVLLLDRSQPGMGASYGNAGLLAQWAIVPLTEPGIWKNIPKYLIDPMSPLFLKWRYLPKLMPWLTEFLSYANEKSAKRTSEALMPLVADAVEQHKSLTKGTPAGTWITDSKFSYAYTDASAFKKDAYAWAIKAAGGMIPEILTDEEVQEEEPICGPLIKCLAVLKGQGHIFNPLGYVRELSKVFESMGGRFLLAKVLDFERVGETIEAIVTDKGRLKCQKTVITAGIWSKNLMRKVGLDVPLETERGYHVTYKKPSQVPKNPMMIAIGKFAVTPMQEGLRCAGTVELGGIDLMPSRAPVSLIRHRVMQAFPNLTYETSEEWMGFRPSTPDSLPVIGELGNSGIFTAFGHQHVGITAGAKTGRMIADLIDRKVPNIDLEPYHPSRYAAR